MDSSPPAAFRDAIWSTKPREGMAGPRNGDRLEYQLHWTLLKALELFTAGRDFLIVLDFHDDVVICDNEAPEHADFVQVKTSSGGGWTAAPLIAQKKGKPSFLARLYDHRVKFGSAARHLVFVSNDNFRMKLKNGSTSDGLTEFRLGDLRDDSKKKLVDAIVAEHALSDPPSVDDCIIFEVSEIPLRGHETYVTGKLGEFLTATFGPRARIDKLVHRVLIGQFRRRANWDHAPTSFEDLRTRKGIARSDLNGMLLHATASEDPDAAWMRHESRLGDTPLNRLQDLKGEYRRVSAELMDYTNDPMRKLMSELTELLRSVDLPLNELEKIVDVVRARSRIAQGSATSFYSDLYLDALILHALERL